MSVSAGPSRPAAWVDAVLRAIWDLPWLLRLVFALAIPATLWVLSSGPRDSQGGGATRAFLHNGAHVVAYVALAGTLWLLQARDRARPWGAALAVLCAVTYGLVDELHQRSVPGRACSIADLLTDSVGAVLGVAVLGWRRTSPCHGRGSWVVLLLVLAVGSVGLATFGPW